MTFDLFGDTSNTQSSHQLIQLPGAELLFLPALFEQQEADALLVDLTHNIAWQQESISLYGQQHLLPRLTAWYGDEGSRYQYSAVNLHALPWTPTLLSIKQRMEAHSGGVQFNSVLLNLYRNGSDGVAWHSDNEAELGSNPIIASVSFGQERPFQLRHNQDKNLKYSLPLPHGSLLIMRGETQRNWLHQIPKSTKKMAPRINLTFRVVR